MEKKIETFEEYGIKVPYRRRNGNVKCVCPNCKNSGRSHPEDKSLSVNLDTGVWHCHYCGWSGGLRGYEGRRILMKKSYRRPSPLQETGLSLKLINYCSLRGISLETLQAMHIAEGKEFMPQANKEMNTVQFPYYLEGELINVKYRTGDKKFKMVAGAELIPYNIDGIKDKEEAIIVEGEWDALSFIEAGIENVVSVPNGANANLEWLDDFMEGWFDDKATIYIAVDNDEKGLALRDELVRRFGAERCMVVEWSAGCKDANDQLKEFGSESLRNCVTGAHEVKVGGIYSLADYENELDAMWRHGLQRGRTIGHENFDKLISFETKRLMVVTGVPSSGKSEFIDEMVVRLNIRYGWKAAFFSPENLPIEYHASKIMEKLTGKKFNEAMMPRDEYERAKVYYGDNFKHILPEGKYTLEAILDKAQFLVRRIGIKVLVIDPYNRIESDIGTQSETNYISKILDQLTNFAQRNDVLVCLMAHPRKINRAENADGIPTFYDINGSANFYNKADYGLIIHRNRDEGYTLVRVAKVKFRHLGENGDALFKYNVENGRYVPYVEGQPVVMDNSNYLGESGEVRVESAPSAPDNNYDFLNKGEEYCPF